jgi:uncharacterized protein YcbK (DUF882 family)
MLSSVLHMKLATAMMASWMSAASPMPLPIPAMLAVDFSASAPLEVSLYDENRRVSTTVAIRRDGTTDAATTTQLAHLFRCISTNRESAISPRTLAMLVDLSERYGKPITFVSAYRRGRKDGPQSPHRAARAIDFKIAGEDLREVRDYLWRTYTEVGIGWYPYEHFIHMDSRPHEPDVAWTFDGNNNRYHPYWAESARHKQPRPEASARRPGS